MKRLPELLTESSTLNQAAHVSAIAATMAASHKVL
jgi:hypothetical protein